MIRTDCHLHTSFSSDSKEDMENMILAAADKGLDLITFTEHMDLKFPDVYELPFVYDQDAYEERLDQLAGIYSDRIKIYKGIEIGLKPDLDEDYKELLKGRDYDFVIGSTHLVDDVDPYYPEYWVDRSEKESIIKYFELVYENINSVNGFNSLGHLDYILRYAPSKQNSISYKEYADIVDEILKVIIRKDIALEINSSGYKSGLNAPNPSYDIIKHYKDLNGQLITIGSDAHSCEYISYKFDKIEDMLLSLSFDHYNVYKAGTPIDIAIGQ